MYKVKASDALADALRQIIGTAMYDADGYPDHQKLYDKIDDIRDLASYVLKRFENGDFSE